MRCVYVLITPADLHCVSTFCFYFLDTVLSSLVIQQSPVALLIKPGQEASLECYHGDSNYNYMLWYKSAAGGQRAMDLIGYLYNENPNLEKTFNNRFTITGNSKAKAQLVISNVNLSDTAEYFCAASQHSVSTRLAPLQKAGGS